MINISLNFFNLLKILFPVSFFALIISFSFYLYFIFEGKRIFPNVFFEIIVFFLPFLSLVISIYILTKFKNPFFSFSFIFLLFSYISLKINIELKREVSFLLFLFSIFFLSASLTLYLDSEKMLFVKDLKDIFYSWNVFAKFFVFLTLFLIFFSILKRLKFLFYFLAFLLPLFYFWDTLTLPDVSLNNIYFFLSLASILSLVILIFLFESKNELFKYLFLIVIFLPLTISRDISTFFYVEKENIFLVEERIKEEMEKLPKPHVGGKTEEVEISGKKIFDDVCSSCHSFERKVVGPPFVDVLPKYEENKEKLFEFIKKPYKINPEYPPMPELGLKEEEIKAVIDYLFEEVKKHEN